MSFVANMGGGNGSLHHFYFGSARTRFTYFL